MIDLKLLVITLRFILFILAVTTLAAIVHKAYSKRGAYLRRRFLEDLRAQFRLLEGSESREAALRRIAAALMGRWSLLAAEQVSQLELDARLQVVRALEERGVVARYVRAARSPLKWKRANALRVLGEIKVPASVPVVLEALDDRDPDVRNVAARSLARMKLQAAEEALVALLGKHEQSVSARIAAMCIEMGTRTAPLLIRTLRDGAPKARFWAARILGEIKERQAAPVLAEALHDAEADVRSAAAWALGSIADPSSVAVLENGLRDPVWYVRAHAAEALGKIGDPSIAGSLGEALADRSWWVRKNALDALVRLGQASRPALQRALESNDRFARDCAIEALTVLGVPVAAPRTGTAA